MDYQLETTKQIYANQAFLTHKLVGDEPSLDRHLFGMRVESLGYFNFKQINKEQTKQVKLSEQGINTPISLVSIYAFANNSTSDEVEFRLKHGNNILAKMQIKYYEMPFAFPKGAVIAPELSIEVKPKNDVSQLLIYWQPIHILKEVVVN